MVLALFDNLTLANAESNRERLLVASALFTSLIPQY